MAILLLIDHQADNFAARSIGLRIDKAHIEPCDFFLTMAFHNFINNSIITAKNCAALRVERAFDFNVLNVIFTGVFYRKVGLHHIAESCLAPCVLQLNKRKNFLWGRSFLR